MRRLSRFYLCLALSVACAARSVRANYPPGQLKNICRRLAPSPDDSGFVCLEANSTQYLRCHAPELVWTLMNCSAPLRCVAPVMTWNITDPCGYAAPPMCGNGVLDDTEECEIGGVGCSTNCSCLPGFAVSEPASADCVPISICGDGVLDSEEQCEIGGVGCAADCTCEDGFKPASPVALDCVPVRLCGNGIMDKGEQCEVNGTGCSANCTCLPRYIPTTPPSKNCTFVSVCGDGFREGDEECEVGGIGCTANCTCAVGYKPATPLSVYCVLDTDPSESESSESEEPICGDGVVAGAEECEVGGAGCKADCRCAAGYKPTAPVAFDCVLDIPTDPSESEDSEEALCGDGVVAGAEQCEVGGVGCTLDCACDAGFVPTDPVSIDCVERTEPLCGDGILDEGEECEVGGVGCTEACLCDDGFVPTSPLSMDCTSETDAAPTSELALCELFTDSDEDAGFVCLGENATEYLRCHLLEEVAVMMPCPAGTRCRAPVDVFTTFNPCLWEAPFPVEDYLWIYDGEPRSEDGCMVDPTCGNGALEAGEECEMGGTGCTMNCSGSCTCAEYFRPSDPAAIDCVLDYDAVCAKLFNDTGRETSYFCPSTLYAENSSVVVHCNGTAAALELCDSDCFCAAEGVFAESPCNAARVNRCGDGEINAGEECDGGAGCTENCTCAEGFEPTMPAGPCCVPVVEDRCADFALLCHEFDATGFFCTDYFAPNDTAVNNTFVLCDRGEFVGEFDCPSGTTCGLEKFALENPCFQRGVCGNNYVEDEEECEVGGFGCNETTCKCMPGFSPMGPATHDCKFTNATAVCEEHACLAMGENHFGCIDGLDDYFVFCPGDRTQPVVEQCPRGTRCAADAFTVDVPCRCD